MRSVPGKVLTAGYLWLGFGVVGTLLAAVSFTVAAGQGSNPGSCCAFVIPIAFMVVGWQTVKGTAKDVIGNSIGSFIFGAFYLILGLACIFVLSKQAQLDGAVVSILGIVSSLIGILLLTAGGMALSGRVEYLQWRSRGKKKKKRRQVEVDEDDDEGFEVVDDADVDRPRRRRNLDDDEDDTPRRRNETEDDDDRPRRRPRRDD